MCHIKKLNKQHGHYTGAPCAGDNKQQHNATEVLRKCAIGMLTAGMYIRAVARAFNVIFSTIIWIENLAVRLTGLTTADHM